MPDARFRPILTLLSGNLLGTAVAGAFFLSASWKLGLDEMGRYAVAISVQWLVFGLVGAGTAVSVLRHASDRLLAEDRAGAAGFVALGALSSLGVAVALAGIAYAGLSTFAPGGLLSPTLVALAVSWAGARACLDCLRSGLLAQQAFPRVARLTAISATTGLMALAWTLSRGELSVERLLVAHVAGLSAGALASLPLLRGLAQDGSRLGPGRARELFAYARWPALSEGTRLAQANLGTPLLAALAGTAEAGLLGVGRYPAYAFEVVAVTLYQYWLASAVRVPDRASMQGYLRAQLRLSGALGVAMVVAAVAAQPLIPLLGENFTRVGPLFVASAIDFSILLLVRPIETAYHGLRAPRLELAQRCLTLLALCIAAFALAPRWGALGMAAAQIVSSVVSLAAGALLLRGALAVERPA